MGLLRACLLIALCLHFAGSASAQLYYFSIWTSTANSDSYTSGKVGFTLYGSDTTSSTYSLPSISTRSVNTTVSASNVGTLLALGITPNSDNWRPERIVVTYKTDTYLFKFAATDSLSSTATTPTQVNVCAVPQSPPNGAFDCASTYSKSAANTCVLACNSGYVPSSSATGACPATNAWTITYSNADAQCVSCAPAVSCASLNRQTCRGVLPNVCGPCKSSYGVTGDTVASTSDLNVMCTTFITYTIMLLMSVASGAATDLPCTLSMFGTNGYQLDDPVSLNDPSTGGLSLGKTYTYTVQSAFFGYEAVRGLKITCDYKTKFTLNPWLPSYIEVSSDDARLGGATLRYNFLNTDRLDYGTWLLFAPPPSGTPANGKITCTSSFPGSTCAIKCDTNYAAAGGNGTSGVMLPSGSAFPFSTASVDSATCVIDCSTRNNTYCASLNRQPCGAVSSTCGPCMDGFNTSSRTGSIPGDTTCVQFATYDVEISTGKTTFSGPFYMTIFGDLGSTDEILVKSNGFTASRTFTGTLYGKYIGTNFLTIQFRFPSVTRTTQSWSGDYIY
eukprot:Opistho-2@63683